MAAEVRYFIPVCLYPHTKYRTNEGLSALFEKYRLQTHDYLIVIADRLLVLDRLVTGRYWTLSAATMKARREAEQIFQLIKRNAHKHKAADKGKICYWDDIANDAEFAEFTNCIRSAILAEATLSEAIDRFVRQRVDKFGLGSQPESESGHEREYLLSEVCMSVYCTEILGFSTEVWERPPGPEVPDPLKLLYDHHRGLVAQVAAHPARRNLSFLFDR